MTVYRPPTRVVTTSIPYLAMVNAADPDFQRRKYREVEYEFQGKASLANPYVRGAYEGELVPNGVLNDASAASFTTGSAAPDWQMTASKFIEDNTVDFHTLAREIGKSAEAINYVFSGNFKYNGRHLGIGIANLGFNGGIQAGVDLQRAAVIDGSIVWGGDFVGGQLFIGRVSNGYISVVLTGTSDADTTVVPYIQSLDSVASYVDVPGVNDYQGDGVSGFFYTNLSFQRLNV